MRIVRVGGCALLATCFLAPACEAATKVYLAVSQPAEVSLPESVKRIAVVEFTSKDARSTTYGDIAAARLNSFLGESPCAGTRYELIDRTHLKGVLAEQDLGASGITDSKTAVQAGKILNADAIVFGTVNVETSEETVEKPSISMGGYMPSVKSKSSVRRSAVVNVTFNMICPETGKIIITRSVSRSYDSSTAGGQKGLKKLLPGKGSGPSTEMVVNDLIEQCVEEFGSRVASHVSVYEFELASSKRSKAGNTFAEAGDFESAAKQYELAAEADPKEHAAVYNLAIARLMLNDPKAAVDLFDRAVSLKTEKRYIQARQQLAEILKSSPNAQFQPASAAQISAFKAAEKLKD